MSLSLYRSLLRLGRQMDSKPASKLLLFRKQATLNGKLARNLTAKYYQHVLLRRLFPHDDMKLLSPASISSTSLSEIVKEEFSRQEFELEEGYNSEVRVDAAFAALRNLSTVWKAYESMEAFGSVVKDHLQKEFGNGGKGEKDVDSKKTNIETEKKSASKSKETDSSSTSIGDLPLPVAPHNSVLMPGVVLAAHPMVKGPLHRAVVLLLDHNTQGTYGVVLNRPTSHTLETAVKNLPQPLLEGFGQNKVAFGGMIRRLQYLHDLPEAGEGATQLPLCRSEMYVI